MREGVKILITNIKDSEVITAPSVVMAAKLTNLSPAKVRRFIFTGGVSPNGYCFDEAFAGKPEEEEQQQPLHVHETKSLVARTLAELEISTIEEKYE